MKKTVLGFYLFARLVSLVHVKLFFHFCNVAFVAGPPSFSGSSPSSDGLHWPPIFVVRISCLIQLFQYVAVPFFMHALITVKSALQLYVDLYYLLHDVRTETASAVHLGCCPLVIVANGFIPCWTALRSTFISTLRRMKLIGWQTCGQVSWSPYVPAMMNWRRRFPAGLRLGKKRVGRQIGQLRAIRCFKTCFLCGRVKIFQYNSSPASYMMKLRAYYCVLKGVSFDLWCARSNLGDEQFVYYQVHWGKNIDFRSWLQEYQKRRRWLFCG